MRDIISTNSPMPAGLTSFLPERVHTAICCSVITLSSVVAPILALSTAEAEMIALCCCAQEAAFCRKLANELGFMQLSPTPIYEDNLGVKSIPETGYFRGRSKHYQLRWG